MRSIPVDAEAFTGLVITAVEVVAATNFDTGVQQERDNVPLWTCRLLVREGTDESRRPEVIEVKVPAAKAPVLEPSRPVHFGGLRALHWQQGDRAGLAFQADTIATDNTAAKTQQSKSSEAAS